RLSCVRCFCCLLSLRPRCPPLFPYTTLFRSVFANVPGSARRAPTDIARSRPDVCSTTMPEGGGSELAGKRDRVHRLVVVAVCAAIIAALAGGVVVLVDVLGSDEPAPTSQHARDQDSGGAGGAAGATRAPSESNGKAPQKVIKLADHPLMTKTGVGLPNNACELPEWE